MFYNKEYRDRVLKDGSLSDRLHHMKVHVNQASHYYTYDYEEVLILEEVDLAVQMGNMIMLSVFKDFVIK